MLDVIIDISHHNTISDWSKIKQSGILGVIHKATQGTTFVDEKYHECRQQALAQNLLFGAYHFGECGDPQAQAQHFLDTVQPEPSDLLVLDFEPCSATMALQDAELFVRIVVEATGRLPGLYSGQSFLTDCCLGITQTVLQGCFLWIARYSMQMPVVPPLWETWSLWQYTDSGMVPGVTGACDRNQWNGDEAGLYRLWGVDANTPLV